MFNLSYVQLGLRLFQFLALAASKLLKLQDNSIPVQATVIKQKLFILKLTSVSFRMNSK